MAQYELVVCKGGLEFGRFGIGEGGLTIGRSMDADVILTENAVSRTHARVYFSADKIVIEDLGSRNGIYVNGRLMRKTVLSERDRFQIGDYLFSIERSVPVNSSSTTISYHQGTLLYERMVSPGDEGRLPVLYRAAHLLGSVFDMDDLLSQILGLIFEAVPARRGFILTIDAATQMPVIRASHSLETAGEGPPLSRTLIDRVLGQKDAVMTMDALEDERFDASKSVTAHAIRSAICVPLCGRQGVIGALYVDSGAKAMPFSHGDFELLMALGRVVGLTVENAQLHHDKIEQERLAAIGLAMASVGHCVKNILTGMKGGAEIVEEATKSKEWRRVEWGWPVLKRSIDRIEGLMLNLLMLSKERVPERTATDLNQIIEDVLGTMELRARDAHAELHFDPVPLPPAYVDSALIYRLALNLIVNAIEACQDQGGHVKVVCTADSSGHTIQVSDTGCGILPEIIPHLFDAFSSTKGSRGTGLGLACCRKIVSEHGGTIECSSEPGKGSTFTVFLPSTDSANAQAPMFYDSVSGLDCQR